MSALFDFAPNSHVAEEIPPEQPEVRSLNGWDYTVKPAVPYRRKFSLKLSGMRWVLNEAGDGLECNIDPHNNAGRLLKFWQDHLNHTPFTYKHEYLGNLQVRFAGSVNIPKSIGNSGGLIPEFEITLVHHNPGY